MSEKDLVKVKSKDSRNKQVLIKLEHATADVQSLGHKIGDQNKEIAELKAKLETKEKLLEEALDRLRDIHDDSTEKTDTHTDDPDLD